MFYYFYKFQEFTKNIYCYRKNKISDDELLKQRILRIEPK